MNTTTFNIIDIVIDRQYFDNIFVTFKYTLTQWTKYFINIKKILDPSSNYENNFHWDCESYLENKTGEWNWHIIPTEFIITDEIWPEDNTIKFTIHFKNKKWIMREFFHLLSQTQGVIEFNIKSLNLEKWLLWNIDYKNWNLYEEDFSNELHWIYYSSIKKNINVLLWYYRIIVFPNNSLPEKKSIFWEFLPAQTSVEVDTFIRYLLQPTLNLSYKEWEKEENLKDVLTHFQLDEETRNKIYEKLNKS